MIKALKVSADEVQDVIAARLIPMVQERENLIDSGKPKPANTHLRVNLLWFPAYIVHYYGIFIFPLKLSNDLMLL